MKPSQLLYAKSSEKGVILVAGLYNNKLRIMGSSTTIKAVQGDDYSNSVALSIKKGDRGFIAINMADYSGKRVDHFSFFLKIEWNEDSALPFIDLDSQWVPMDSERLGVIGIFGIRIKIGGLIFSSSKFDKEPDMRYVSDNNLLCGYLAGDIEADVVEKAATEYIEEESAKARLPELEKKIQELTALVVEKEKLLAKKEELVLAEKESAEKYYQQGVRMYKKLNAASKVIEEVEKQWFHKPSLMEAIQIYKAVMTRE